MLLPNGEATGLLEEPKLVDEPFLDLIPLRISVRSLHFCAGLRAFFGYVHHVGDPGGDRLDQHLSPFFFQEGDHVEIAIASGGLRPEFARDLDDRL
jgi:hypothetical protein